MVSQEPGFVRFSPFLHRQGGCCPVSFLAVMLPRTTACSLPSRQNIFYVSSGEIYHKNCCPDRWFPGEVGNTDVEFQRRKETVPNSEWKHYLSLFLCRQTLSLLTHKHGEGTVAQGLEDRLY